MLLVGLIVAVIFGIHISIANHGCPDEPADCYDYCNQEKGCLMGFCDMTELFITCTCRGCSNKTLVRYMNYGCKKEDDKTKPPETSHTKFNQTSFMQKIRDMIYGVGLKANIWKDKD